MNPGYIFLIVIGVFVGLFSAIFLPLIIISTRTRNIVENHSVALKRLKVINAKYNFNKIEKFTYVHDYDNENMYKDISCRDYLTYQLVYNRKKVNKALKDTLENKNSYNEYIREIKESLVLGQYDTDKKLSNLNRLIECEKELLKKLVLTPQIEFSISVLLRLTNINGAFRSSKRCIFKPKEIKDIIFKLNQKNGDFYLNNEVWESICRVERGKVTNKMRFAVYERDHYRCRKCGRKTNDLEVDHIIPIAKGGKSTFNNLQTLCHKCNVEKGTNIEYKDIGLYQKY